MRLKPTIEEFRLMAELRARFRAATPARRAAFVAEIDEDISELVVFAADDNMIRAIAYPSADICALVASVNELVVIF